MTATFVGDGYPIASIREVQSRFVDLSKAKRTTSYFYESMIEGGRKPQAGDLILSRNATVGEVAQVTASHPHFAMGQDVCLLRKKSKDQSTDFLQALFASSVVLAQFEDAMVGSTFKRVNVEQIRNLAVPFPPPPEQRAIASALSDVDALLEGLTRLIAKKRDLKQAATQQLLTGQTRLPGFSGEWEVSTVGAEFDVQLGKMLDAEKNVGEPKPFIGTRAVQWSGIDVADLQTVLMSRTDIERYRLQKGDLLVCEGGEVGRAAIWDAPVEECYFQKALHRLRPKSGFSVRFMANLLRLWVDRGLLANYVTQTSIAHLPREKFIQIPLLVPTSAEQSAIADALSDMDTELSALEARREKTIALKQAMMQELLAGRTRLV